MNDKKGVVPTSIKWNSSQIHVTDLLLSYMYVGVPKEDDFKTETIGTIYEKYGDDIDIFTSKMHDFIEGKLKQSKVFIDNNVAVDVSPYQDGEYKGFTLTVGLPDRNKEISSIRLLDDNGILNVVKKVYNNG